MRKVMVFFLVLMVVSLAIGLLHRCIVSTAQPTESTDNELVGDSWIKKAGIPHGGVLYGVAAVNGKIYAFGAYKYNETLSVTVGVYDPSTDRWTTKTPMQQPRINFATVVYENKIYIIGGQDNAYSPAYKTVEVYDPANDKWTYSTPMPEPRALICANAVSGKIYVIGGTTSPTPNTRPDCGITNSTQVYDPNTNTWSTAAAIPDAVCRYASTVFEEKIYLFGGLGIFITPTVLNNSRVNILATNSTYIYDPITNVWSLGEQIPKRTAGAVACATTGEKAPKGIYVFEGAYSDYGGGLRLTQVYNPTSYSWINGTIIPEYSDYYRAIVLDDIMYVMGGVNTNQTPWLGNPPEDNPPPTLAAFNYQYIPFGYGTVGSQLVVTHEPTNRSQIDSNIFLVIVVAVVIVLIGVLIVSVVLKRKKGELSN